MVGIERRKTHQPMHAVLGFQITESIRPGNTNGDVFDADFFAAGFIQDFGLKAAFLGPAQVHPLQHLGPILGLGTACPGVNL